MPICGNKTRTKIRPDTILENFPLFCPKCKQEALISAKDLNVAVIPQQIAESAGAVNGQDERRINAPPLTALPVSADGNQRRATKVLSPSHYGNENRISTSCNAWILKVRSVFSPNPFLADRTFLLLCVYWEIYHQNGLAYRSSDEKNTAAIWKKTGLP